MDTVTMDSVGVSKFASDFVIHREYFMRYVVELSSLIERLSSEWQGEDAKEYIDHMRDNEISELKRIGDILERYCSYLKQVPEVYQLCDEAYSGKVIDF